MRGMQSRDHRQPVHVCFSREGWQSGVCDVDPEALKRMQNDIYPAHHSSRDKESRDSNRKWSEQESSPEKEIFGNLLAGALEKFGCSRGEE